MKVNHAAAAMAPSGIREIMNAAWGRLDVLHLEVGEPDFATPAAVVAAAGEAAAAGHTGYTPTAGIPALRSALAEKIRERNGFSVEPEQIVLGNGGAQAIHASLTALTERGDGILLPDPAWPNFVMMATLLGLDVASYPLTPAGGFVPEIADLEQLVTPRTRVLLLNSPSNPLGSVIDRQRMTQLLDFAARHGLWVLSDECYDEITFDGTAVSPAALDADGRVVTVFSFSKTYAMTGWRLGYAAAPPEVAEVLAKAQEPLISCINTPTQYAGLAALASPPDVVGDMVRAYRQRRDTVVGLLDELGLPAFRPAGAFYAWVDVSAAGVGAREVALRLLAEEGVALAPGTAFGRGGEGFVRLSLAASEETLAEGSRRLARLVERLAQQSA
ncbi:MAG: aspartate aminotransferase [Blastococcus sp.]|jgi:aspartate aminotransferase|nr:aspartate aminotransferase [Blastococcus sp.]